MCGLIPNASTVVLYTISAPFSAGSKRLMENVHPCEASGHLQ